MKPIFLTDEEKIALKKEMEEAIEKGCLIDGSFTFSRKYVRKNEDKVTATIYFTPGAYLKMKTLIEKFSSEVAWHGLIRRLGQTEWIIYDLLVFKQNVTGATVTTDDESYVKFLMDLPEEDANHMHMHGHSHVNMGVTPSSTDIAYQQDVLSNLNGKGFYLFQIWNKSMKSTSLLYDFENGVMYENKDIVIDIVDDAGFSLSDFIVNSEKLVINKATTFTTPAIATPAQKTSVKSAKNRIKDDEPDIFTDPDSGIQYFRTGYTYDGKFYRYD